jgi:hypothetical protein
VDHLQGRAGNSRVTLPRSIENRKARVPGQGVSDGGLKLKEVWRTRTPRPTRTLVRYSMRSRSFSPAPAARFGRTASSQRCSSRTSWIPPLGRPILGTSAGRSASPGTTSSHVPDHPPPGFVHPYDRRRIPSDLRRSRPRCELRRGDRRGRPATRTRDPSRMSHRGDRARR